MWITSSSLHNRKLLLGKVWTGVFQHACQHSITAKKGSITEIRERGLSLPGKLVQEVLMRWGQQEPQVLWCDLSLCGGFFYEGIDLALIAGGGHIYASFVLKSPFENCYCSLVRKTSDVWKLVKCNISSKMIFILLHNFKLLSFYFKFLSTTWKYW